MAQSRISLDEEIRQVIDQIQAKTRSPSPSSAIALMVSRYGRHLLETWEIDPTRYADPNPANYYLPAISTPSPVPVDPEFSFTTGVEL